MAVAHWLTSTNLEDVQIKIKTKKKPNIIEIASTFSSVLVAVEYYVFLNWGVWRCRTVDGNSNGELHAYNGNMNMEISKRNFSRWQWRAKKVIIIPTWRISLIKTTKKNGRKELISDVFFSIAPASKDGIYFWTTILMECWWRWKNLLKQELSSGRIHLDNFRSGVAENRFTFRGQVWVAEGT